MFWDIQPTQSSDKSDYRPCVDDYSLLVRHS
jgi:hypothetical protein